MQCDAAIDDGQSGSVLVSSTGAVVGMTVFGGFSDTLERRYPRSTCCSGQLPCAPAGTFPLWRGNQNLAAWAQCTPMTFDLANAWAERAFAIGAQPEDEVSFDVQSVSDLALTLVDSTGDTIAEVDERGAGGTETISIVVDGLPPFLLLVSQFDDRQARVRIEGDARLVPVNDPDDGVTLELPVRRVGAIDYPYDVDYYLLSLNAGETISVLVGSVLIDPLLNIDYRYAPELATDDDSGGGLFGFDAELIFHAEVDRVHRIAVTDPYGYVGGYTITVKRETD